MIYKSFDIVIVPFPFVDSSLTKVRPALVLSNHESNKQGSVVLVMITSAQHNKRFNDVLITNLESTNLPSASIIRMKLFTLDLTLVHKKIGVLSERDQMAFKKIFKQLFKDLI